MGGIAIERRIGPVSAPRPDKNGELFVRADIAENVGGPPNTLLISGVAIRQYFYLLDTDPPHSLYDLLRINETATLAELRIAWRMRALELRTRGANRLEHLAVERAFNILAHAELRACYDALRRDDDAPPLFPYGGFGSIVVEGRPSADGGAFFADRIRAYKPEMKTRNVAVLLRGCEFLADRIVVRDSRRRLEAWIDANLFPSLQWDLSWNHWKRWLRTRLEVEGPFVRADERGSQIALPSRLRVTVPGGADNDVRRARAMHVLLGEHADLLRHVRARTEKEAIEHKRIESWFVGAQASSHLKPQHTNWLPDYEPYYFDELRQRSESWFVFRDEYLFVWNRALICEIPAPGHATYLFKKPSDLDNFLTRFAALTREDIRRNVRNEAAEIGFIGRVTRGRNRERWLRDLVARAGESPGARN